MLSVVFINPKTFGLMRNNDSPIALCVDVLNSFAMCHLSLAPNVK